MNRFFKIATLFVPSWAAAIAILEAHPKDEVLHIGAPLLVVAWVLMLGAIIVRAIGAPRPRTWNLFDVLTATGRSTLWASACAIGLAIATGFASLSILGVLGFATVFAAAIWTTLAAGGKRPWKAAKFERSVLPEMATEGESMREELKVAGLKIPAGTRWFATGRVARNGSLTRYALGADASEAETVMESDLGAVQRGDHAAPPMAMWFGDVLGMARTPIAFHAPARAVVLPKPIPVDGAKDLLGPGGQSMKEVPAQRMPTEGTFRIREYQPGDDTRRIHWVRSIQANQLVVRLPDEIPPADPAVRVVLDNCMWGTEYLTCRGHEQLLDALVRVWLGVAKNLAEGGSRVTLVTAADVGKGVSKVERPMITRTPREALKLGAKVRWQADVNLIGMMAKGASKTIVVSTRPQRLDVEGDVSWVVLPEGAWTTHEEAPPQQRLVTLPFATGSGDNRFVRRAAEQRRVATMWRDRAVFSELVSWIGADKTGAFVALQTPKGVKLQVLP